MLLAICFTWLCNRLFLSLPFSLFSLPPGRGSEHSLKGRLRNKKWVCAQTNVPLMYNFVIYKFKRRCILKECLRKHYSMLNPNLIEYVDSRFYVYETPVQFFHVPRRIYCGLYSTYAKCDV